MNTHNNTQDKETIMNIMKATIDTDNTAGSAMAEDVIPVGATDNLTVEYSAFDSIAGYKHIKQEGREIVDMLSNSEKYRARGARFPKGWMLYGKPGIGKSKIVHCVSVASGVDIVEISQQEAIRRKLGVEEMIVSQFARAKSRDKAILLIDDMDKLVGYSRDYEVVENLHLQKILLNELENINSGGDVIVIATANDLSLVQGALLRSGRFDRMIRFFLPMQADREALFQHYLSNVQLDDKLNISEHAEFCQGCTCADIECICNEAIISSIRRDSSTVNSADINLARNRILNDDIQQENVLDDANLKKVAYHEAGHAIVNWHLGNNNRFTISILPQGDSMGMMLSTGKESQLETMKSKLDTVRISLAGSIAVEQMTGDKCTGGRSDIRRARDIIMSLMDEAMYGYDCCIMPYDNNRSRSYFPDYAGWQSDKRISTLASVLEQCHLEAQEILSQYTAELEILASALIERKELEYEEALAVLNSCSVAV